MQTGTRGNPNASILIVGEAWGSEENKQRQPFVGASGVELERMLQEAGINPADCYYTNVVNAQPPRNDMKHFFVDTKMARKAGMEPIRGLYPNLAVLEGIEKLEELITKLRPKLIIAAGNYPLWALTEDKFKIGNSDGYKIPTGITSYRGSQLRSRFFDIPLLPIYHPAAVLRQMSWRPAVVHDLRMRAQKILRGESWDEPERNYIVQPSFDQAMGYMQGLLTRASMVNAPLLLAVDIETSQRFIECVGLAASATEAICIPIMCRERWEGYWSWWEELEIFSMLKRLLEHPNVEVCGQNFIYDYYYFAFQVGCRPNYKQDTMLAHHTIYPGTPMGLDALSSMYCDYHCYWKDDGKEASKNHDDLERWRYNARDCVVTYEVIETEWTALQHYDLEWQYGIQMARANAAINMMLRGVRLDQRRQGDEAKLLLEAGMAIEAMMEEYVPESVFPRKPKAKPWYRSPTQQAELFYDVLGVKEVISRKTGSRTCDDDALELIAGRLPIITPLILHLQDYRSLQTFGEFVNMKPSLDGRVRCTYSPTTETFRYRSSENPLGTGRNLQNIPVGNEEDD